MRASLSSIVTRNVTVQARDRIKRVNEKYMDSYIGGERGWMEGGTEINAETTARSVAMKSASSGTFAAAGKSLTLDQRSVADEERGFQIRCSGTYMRKRPPSPKTGVHSPPSTAALVALQRR